MEQQACSPIDSLQQALEQISSEVDNKIRTGSTALRSDVKNIYLYTIVFDKCNEKPNKCEAMLDQYKANLAKHLEVYGLKKLSIDEANFVRVFNEAWLSYSLYMKILVKQVFCYLDRYYLQSRDLPDLTTVGTSVFQKIIFSNPFLGGKFLNSFVVKLGQIRKRMIINNQDLAHFSRQFKTINPKQLYEELRMIYIKETEEFYKVKHEQAKRDLPLEYLTKTKNLYYFEEMVHLKCFYWPNETSEQDRLFVNSLFQRHIVEPYTDILLNHSEGLVKAIENRNIYFLNTVLQVYSIFEGLKKIRACYYDHLIVKGKQLISSIEKQTNEVIISSLTHFINSQLSLVNEGFNKNQQIFMTVNNAFEAIFGKWEKLAQILYDFCRKCLDNNTFKSNEETVKLIFQKLSSKDEFIHLYQKSLENTIIHSRLNVEKEQNFIKLIHSSCGSENTLKLQKIMTDYLQNNSLVENGQTTTKILSSHLWDKRFQEELTLNINLTSVLQQKWNNYIPKRYPEVRKKLFLLPLESKLVLIVKFNEKQVEVNCNMIQSCIILEIAAKAATIEELVSILNVQKSLVISILQLIPFINHRQQKYEICWDYKAEGNIDLDSKVQTQRKYSKSIEQDRNILLQAYVVRLAKRKKQVTFEQIYEYVCSSIKLFKPQPAMLKNTIQKLVKRTFLEQNEQGMIIYKQ